MDKQSDALKFIVILAKLQTAMIRRFDSKLGGLGLNEFIILTELAQADGKLRRTDLAERIGLTASGVTRLLLPMEKIGLIKRESHESDARASYVVIAKGGKTKLEEGLERAEIFCEELFNDDDAEKLNEISAYMKRLSLFFGIISHTEQHAKEAREKWGETDAYKQSAERAKKLTKEDWERIKNDGDNLMRDIVAYHGKGPDSREIQTLIDRHYNSLRTFYEPNLEMYRGLADMYVADPKFAAHYDKYKEGLALFMRDAMNIYCDLQEQ